jgi:mono/diheme cytochrome c family protein
MRPHPSIAYSLLLGIVLTPGVSSRADEKPALPADHEQRMKVGLALFREKIRPVLIRSCLECHGGEKTKGDFDLSDRKPLLESGAIEGPGKESYLYALITHAEEPHMPQKGPKLPAETADDIAHWIDLGAPYDRPLVERPGGAAPQARTAGFSDEERNFWSFRPLAAVAPPAVRAAAWCRTPIDRFIRATLEEHGLRPNPPADRRVLIRRVTFDLIGLPPAPAEVDAFIADPEDDADAYERLVDRLLGSPAYGERWARHWMDVARFAESHGYEQDYDRKYAYHYRDFLIRALNQDMPFDQFARWQIAGDELAPDDPMALAATGFLGAGAFPTQLTEAEFESARYEELSDMTATTGVAFLGLSVGCARCHDHKFDPIPSEDYYRMAATFTTTIRSEIDPPGATPGDESKMQVTSEGFPHTKHNADGRGFPHFYPKTYVLARGDVNQKKREAPPGFLTVLMRDGRDASSWRIEPPPGWTRTGFHRAALAHWLTDTEGGAGALAARVAVNRLWQHHFGRGIVATPNDFGAQGERPSHPELLEWLAAALVQGGWRLKPLHKQIVTSAVYMQGDQFDESRAAIDREDDSLWRRAPLRLEAEPIRDALLAVSGLLDPRMYGPGSLDPAMPRRSLYFFIKRSQLIPALMLFDWPEHLVSIGQRSETTTASQALLFLNSPLGRAAAEGFAGRLPAEERQGSDAVARAYQIAFGRPPTAAEAQLAARFLGRQTALYERAGRPDPRGRALVDFCQSLMGSSEFIYIP